MYTFLREMKHTCLLTLERENRTDHPQKNKIKIGYCSCFCVPSRKCKEVLIAKNITDFHLQGINV